MRGGRGQGRFVLVPRPVRLKQVAGHEANVETISFAKAKASLSALIDRVAAGETVAITRRGKEIAVLSPPERALKRVDVEALRAISDSTPRQSESAGEFVRRMRDADRY
jgi:prevent-host-death family protein